MTPGWLTSLLTAYFPIKLSESEKDSPRKLPVLRGVWGEEELGGMLQANLKRLSEETLGRVLFAYPQSPGLEVWSCLGPQETVGLRRNG